MDAGLKETLDIPFAVLFRRVSKDGLERVFPSVTVPQRLAFAKNITHGLRSLPLNEACNRRMLSSISS